MAETKFSGIVAARYRPAGDADWINAVAINNLHQDSTLEYERPEEDKTTRGEAPFAGEFARPTIVSWDMAGFAALDAKYKADDRIDLEVTLEEGVTRLFEDILPRCMRRAVQGAVGRLNAWELTPTHFSIT